MQVEPVGGFSYSYELEVNGKSYHKFNENQSRAMRTWMVNLPNDEQYRVVLGKLFPKRSRLSEIYRGYLFGQFSMNFIRSRNLLTCHELCLVDIFCCQLVDFETKHL